MRGGGGRGYVPRSKKVSAEAGTGPVKTTYAGSLRGVGGRSYNPTRAETDFLGAETDSPANEAPVTYGRMNRSSVRGTPIERGSSSGESPKLESYGRMNQSSGRGSKSKRGSYTEK